jgi:hypothetical protein
VPRHFLFLGELFSFTTCGFGSSKIIREQTAAGSLQKKSFTPRPSREPVIKCPFFSALKPRDDFLSRRDEAKPARQIIGGA